MFQTFNFPFLSIIFNYVSTKEIEEIIRSLKTKYSHGYDEIPTKILKWTATFISSPLAYICNKALSSGIFPTRLKFSVVKPVWDVDAQTDNHVVNFYIKNLLLLE
jgi:hypothetical protein